MIIGTAGHIDHGKTALVKALTGVDADRLQEEKTRGITIDLGYAYTPLPHGEILGFVDVPGHEKFIHNMLAGATGIDFALLVVAADDGPMPQTLDHLQILDLLGIEWGAVALTKCDRVDSHRVAEATAEIESLLSESSLAGSPVFPVANLTGEGIPELRAHLETVAANLATPAIRGGFRLAVDRCFNVAGAGTVVTGSILSGRVGVGEHLMLSPSGLSVRVRGIHAQNRPSDFAIIGQRCALNLADVEKSEIQRGDWVLSPQLHLPTTRLDVSLKLLPSETRPLQHWTPVHVHLGAFHATGRVALLRDGPLQPGESAYAQLVLDKPTAAVWGDRCILRDASAQRTLAGGRVLDAQAPVRGRRTPPRLAILTAWQQTDLSNVLRDLIEASPNGVELRAFAVNANLTALEVEELCRRLDLRRIGVNQPVAFAPGHWKGRRQAAIDALRLEHETHLDALGLNAEQLRLRVAPRIARDVFRNLLDELRDEGLCVLDGSWWHLPGHEITLSEKDESLWLRINPLLSKNPFEPPRVRDIARLELLDEAAVRKLLMSVSRAGRIYRVAQDHYFNRAAVAELAEILRQLAREKPDGAVHAAEFRDRIGTGRKLAIHILEFFDRIGLTRRVKDSHRLRNETL